MQQKHHGLPLGRVAHIQQLLPEADLNVGLRETENDLREFNPIHDGLPTPRPAHTDTRAPARTALTLFPPELR